MVGDSRANFLERLLKHFVSMSILYFCVLRVVSCQVMSIS